jgi:hypothetical protein
MMLAGISIATVVIVIAVAQVVLPRIAASDVRSSIEPDGEVLSVKVSAFPAIQLLWHHADTVSIILGDYRTPPSDVPGMLMEARDVGTLNVSIATLRSGLLTLRDVKLTKRGSELVGSARIEDADLRAALPVIDSVTPVSSADGQLTLRGRGGAFGISATVTAVVSASDGKVVLAPTGLLGELLSLTVFDDPGVYVQSVTGAAVSGGLSVSVRAELKGPSR